MPEKRVFGAMILSHGRAGRVLTAKSLRKHGYTGPIIILLDDEDTQYEQYVAEFGRENVRVFSKDAVAAKHDQGDNFTDRRTIFYARNAATEVARSLGWTHYVQLDDDYRLFEWAFNNERRYTTRQTTRLDDIFAALCDFVDDTGCKTICMSQTGDFLGGSQSSNLETINLGKRGKRKAMNTFVTRVDNPISFIGRINEDVNTYVRRGMLGELYFTTNQVRMQQGLTQARPGGMTDIYLNSGTYVKSFYTVMYAPSCTTVFPLLSRHRRWHHRVNWNYAVPKILRPGLRK